MIGPFREYKHIFFIAMLAPGLVNRILLSSILIHLVKTKSGWGNPLVLHRENLKCVTCSQLSIEEQ